MPFFFGYYRCSTTGLGVAPRPCPAGAERKVEAWPWPWQPLGKYANIATTSTRVISGKSVVG